MKEQLTGKVQWLQMQHRQGKFERVRVLYVNMNHVEKENTLLLRRQVTPFKFWQPLLTLSGLWKLSTCNLEGNFDVQQAASLLPATINCLELFPYQLPDELALSVFDRFPYLDTLRVQLDNEDVFETYLDASRDTSFQMDTCFSHLVELQLAPGPLQMPESSTFATALPKICNMCVALCPSHACAKELFNSKSLKELSVAFFSNYMPQPLYLVVSADSQLECLHLEHMPKPNSQCILLSLREKGLDFSCTGTFSFASDSKFVCEGTTTSIDG